ncbi:Nucleolar protein 56 like protein [Argiope bruennichi]|uniref:Nucleolar protein 56 n=1 Tax=Argiope bruennichi TaxID=94029 RepID=A0A8T0EFE9_ARGBR|nr:Nucleolar protein 56 like protein [Argiope bruennichi]
MSKQYILYEHAAGYALFFVAEPEEFLTQTAEIVSEVDKFKEVCHFQAFQPFTRGREALENINSISESILHAHLEELLINNLPKKKKKYVLGVEDTQLINSIKEKLEINCNCTEAVKELIRGIRFHFHDLVPGFCDLNAATKVQLGLAHAYSRSKVKFNIARVDNMIIQTITLVDQMDKDINSLSMKIREWYSHHFPELIKIVPENNLYIPCVNAIKDRKNLSEDVAERLENILNDPEKVQNVLELARSSMGMEVSECDLENMLYCAERVIALIQRRKDLTDYLKAKMTCVAPNLAALIGEFVGARLIAQAGSLTNLAKSPASTVQILGAEKALFRALKTKGNTPKYGIIFNSKFIGKAAKIYKGRISRYLANKCSVASRIDCFRDIPTDVFGSKMKQQVEERLKFYDAPPNSETPRKNVDVMDEALEEAEISQREILKRMKKDKKKAKKRKLEELCLATELDKTIAALAEGTVTDEVDTSIVKKKKKKNKKLNDAPVADEVDTSIEKKKKKRNLNDAPVADEVDTSIEKKKKKRKLNDAE